MLGEKKHVLVAVLNWGLGHATRCIPVIYCLQKHGCKVSIAGNGSSLALLKREFADLDFLELPDYKIRYSARGFNAFHFLKQLPHIFNTIKKEHNIMEGLIATKKIDILISDNRYGCYSDNVRSVFITHQLAIQLPPSLRVLSYLVNRWNTKAIKRFTSCWIPDFDDSLFSGILSRNELINSVYIGALSRFKYAEPVNIRKGLVLALISGPEPQRTVFEELIINQLKRIEAECVVVQGLPHLEYDERMNGKIKIYNHLSTQALSTLISEAEIVIARSGYSTIMDLYALKKNKVIFVPTPGQTEQIYLANEMDRKKIALCQKQSDMNIKQAIEQLEKYNGFVGRDNRLDLLDMHVEKLMKDY